MEGGAVEGVVVLGMTDGMPEGVNDLGVTEGGAADEGAIGFGVTEGIREGVNDLGATEGGVPVPCPSGRWLTTREDEVGRGGTDRGGGDCDGGADDDDAGAFPGVLWPGAGRGGPGRDVGISPSRVASGDFGGSPIKRYESCATSRFCAMVACEFGAASARNVRHRLERAETILLVELGRAFSGELGEIADAEHALRAVREQFEALRRPRIVGVVDQRSREDVIEPGRKIFGLRESRADG